VAGPLIVRILTDLPDVRATAMVYLPWLIASPLISVWCFLYDGVYVGMTRAREMRNIMVVSTFCVFLPLWFVSQPLGNHGLWFALMGFMASRGIGMHLGYRKAMRVAHGPHVSERS
jgi:MATE family multidrug resistance protein